MDFIDQIKALASRIPTQTDVIKTEEATKNAFVMPFIAALGYNVFDPTEVVPELVADVGVKKGEKVDYAIMKDGQPIILFECKWHGTNLDNEHASQLHRYFHVTTARIGVLTNGIVYRFFSDLEEPNKMDSKPFLELNMLDVKDSVVEDVKKFSKSTFALDDILTAAMELKYTREIKRLLGEQLTKPSDEFVKFFASQVYSGKITQKIAAQFNDFTKRAFHQFINDRIQERLKSAMSVETVDSVPQQQPIIAEQATPVNVPKEEKVLTTQEEIEAFHIIKAILWQVVDSKRIVLRDTQSYAGILLDDNNRKPICRLRFNNAGKTVSIMSASRNEEKITISDLNEIYGLADKLKEAVCSYETSPSRDPSPALAGE